MRIDQQIAEHMIKPGSRVLDLGCGDGELLAHLTDKLGVSGYGVEISAERISLAVAKGLSIIEHDLNLGLQPFATKSFDYAVMAQAIQAVDDPKSILAELLRVADSAVVTFPNFAHFKNRYYLGVRGLMPMSKTLPYAWHNTPNIHLCTIKDFENLCQQMNIQIVERRLATSSQHTPWWLKLAPNLLSEVVIYQITQG